MSGMEPSAQPGVSSRRRGRARQRVRATAAIPKRAAVMRIVERTSAGLKAAKARGVQLGRKPSMTPAQAKHARKLIDGGENPRTVARTLGVDRATMYRHLAKLAG